jgi:asparagine synthase (glutamine-hydrolysing)
VIATRLVGYSARTPEEIVASALAGEQPESRPGDFTAIVEGDSGPTSIKVVSSAIAAHPCYAAPDEAGRLHVGADVFTVARSACLPWSWNVRAIRCLALFGHTIGRDTLHPHVYRVPPDVLIRAEHGQVSEHTLGFWERSTRDVPDCGPADVLASLREALRRDSAGHDVLLSLSAGYDSRLLLGLCLEQGLRPRTVTMGPPDATDVSVAVELARVCGLSHERIELNAKDYLVHALAISAATSGVKLAGAWHTYLYARAAGARDREIHLVGSNGEFARSFYLPGRSAILGSRLPPSAVHLYWLIRLERRRLRFRSWPLINGGGVVESARIAYGHQAVGADLSSVLDHFYATERVRHFIGNGLALYSVAGRPRAPFLDADVVDKIRRLPREQRVQNRFHGWAIASIAPRLATLPYNLPFPSASRHVGYSPFSGVRQLPRTAEIVMDCPALDDLVPRPTRERLLAIGSPAEFELLLTLACAGHCVSGARVGQANHTVSVNRPEMESCATSPPATRSPLGRTRSRPSPR